MNAWKIAVVETWDQRGGREKSMEIEKFSDGSNPQKEDSTPKHHQKEEEEKKRLKFQKERKKKGEI